GAAPGQATGDRDVLAQVQPDVRREPGVRGEQPGGLDRQVAVVDRQHPGALALDGQRQVVAADRGQVVVEGDGLVDGVQVVVPVGALGPDAQVQVDLRRYPDPDRPGRHRYRPVPVPVPVDGLAHGATSPAGRGPGPAAG